MGRPFYTAEAGSWKLEAGSWKLEAGSWKLEAGSWKLEGSMNPDIMGSRFFFELPA
ncbi:copper homeostasis protein CutF precursor / Lipoprotein NlpE involeved in surface adhesion [Halomonas beimenensis]|uniref:Copper homeostasis protein CutF / Lipoprotein NlpE involeved in surface adhesion n=1 Tax=Halomonas beimenensis TaxID=475662 RepID=A0A291PA70_9GAMM|nr:copper homeostasis protein CutF precursor / Lipoprotein NlpE involeved in surface adhesion [Halomonas beimenensis]